MSVMFFSSSFFLNDSQEKELNLLLERFCSEDNLGATPIYNHEKGVHLCAQGNSSYKIASDLYEDWVSDGPKIFISEEVWDGEGGEDFYASISRIVGKVAFIEIGNGTPCYSLYVNGGYKAGGFDENFWNAIEKGITAKS